MISVCGVLCSECPAYLGASKGIAHRKRTIEAWQRIYGLKETAEHISCGGRLGPDDQVFHTSRNCAGRRCCRSKGFNSCAECPEDSCEDLEKAQSVWDEVPGLIDKLSSSDFATYARPYCDHRKRPRALQFIIGSNLVAVPADTLNASSSLRLDPDQDSYLNAEQTEDAHNGSSFPAGET